MEEQKEDLGEFNKYCTQGRYHDGAPVKIGEQEASAGLENGERMLQWLLQE